MRKLFSIELCSRLAVAAVRFIHAARRTNRHFDRKPDVVNCMTLQSLSNKSVSVTYKVLTATHNGCAQFFKNETFLSKDRLFTEASILIIFCI